MKTKRIMSVFILSLLTLCVQQLQGQVQQDPQALFTQANELYKNGDFAKAYELYLQIPDKGAAVYYNLGNCAYKLNKLGYALAYWRRAERDWGFLGRDELMGNIDLVKKRLAGASKADEQEVTVVRSVANFCKGVKNSTISLIRAIPLVSLQLFVLFVWLILFIYLRYWYQRKQKFVIICFFLLQAVSASMLAIKYSSLQREKLVVIKVPAPLSSGPGSNFTVLMQLPEGQEADILKESGDFYKIRVNGIIGWIDRRVIEKI